jgi:ATP-binding cassette, subfamily G (WHITE), member 2, SNQ2
LVIDQGRCVFFGPTDIAKQYFEDLGFECPSRQTTADFLTSVTDPNARVLKKDRDPISIPRTSADLERRFRDSPAAKANLDSIRQFEQEVKETHPADSFRDAVEQGKAKRASNRSVYTISFLDQVKACTIRQYQVLWGDKTTFIGKNFLTIFQALIIGSLFYNMPATSTGAFTRGGVMLYVTCYWWISQ